jgi:hypothetical protein
LTALIRLTCLNGDALDGNESSRDKEVSMAGKFELYQDKAEVQIRLKAGNGEVADSTTILERTLSRRLLPLSDAVRAAHPDHRGDPVHPH